MLKRIYEWMATKTDSRHEYFVRGKKYLEQYRPGAVYSSFKEIIERSGEIFIEAQNDPNLAEAEKCFLQAMVLSKAATRYDDVASALYQLGIVKMRQGNYEESQKKFNEAIEISSNIVKASKHGLTIDCYYYMGMNAILHKLFGPAEEYLQQSLNIAKMHGTRKDVTTIQELLNYCNDID